MTSRLSAALLGFVLNRYLTFGQRNETVKRLGASFGRFVVLFITMTVLSTLALLGLQELYGAGLSRSVGYKVAIEAVLAVISFFLSRHWVYRN